MSIRALLWLTGFFGGAVLAVSIHPIYGLVIYFLDYYSHPPLCWWGKDVPELRWSLLAAAVLFVAYNVRRGAIRYDLKVWAFPQTKWFVAFLGYAWLITLSPLAVWKAQSYEMAIMLTKYYVLYCLIIKTASDPKHFRMLLILQLFGLMEWGWGAFENPKREAGRLVRIGGADTLNDNFTAAHLLALLPLLGVGLLVGKRWEKITCFLRAPFLMNLFRPRSWHRPPVGARRAVPFLLGHVRPPEEGTARRAPTSKKLASQIEHLADRVIKTPLHSLQ